jgi:hypothetical protein
LKIDQQTPIKNNENIFGRIIIPERNIEALFSCVYEKTAGVSELIAWQI